MEQLVTYLCTRPIPHIFSPIVTGSLLLTTALGLGGVWASPMTALELEQSVVLETETASLDLKQAVPTATPVGDGDRGDKETGNDESLDDEPGRFGDRGDQRWYIQGAAATTLDNEDARRLGLVGAGLSHFFIDGHSINLELNGLAFDQSGDDAVGLNLNAMLRWHLHRQENWSVYIDGGAGLLGTTNDVPSAGSQLNFTPQVGAGTTIRLNDDQRLMVGLRWHHISNADLYPPNPGRDSFYGYAGLNLPR